MSTLDTAIQIVMGASAAVIAAAAVGIYHHMHGLMETVQKHDRTLYGVEGIDAWKGLVERVADHEAELDEDRDDN